MRYAFVAAHREEFSVCLLCRVLGVSRSGYFAWRSRSESHRSRANRYLLARIRSAYVASRQTYGSPRIHRKLSSQGDVCGRGRVERLMRLSGIRAQRKRRFVVTTDSRHNLPVAENILGRAFAVEGPDRVWASDITYVPTDEGWLYLAGVLDLGMKGVVGWSMGENLDRALVMDALRMAYHRRRPGAGLVHHSDRGSQYASRDYQALLSAYGMRSSMSRKGDCWDNAPMVSFFATLKKELIHQRRFRTREEARREIFEYIEVFYNRERLHSSLGYVSPAEYERQLAVKEAA